VVARYEQDIGGHDNVKKYAKDIVRILVTKELRPGHVVKNPTELSDEKKTKIKTFLKAYMGKVVAKHQAKKHDGGSKNDDADSPSITIKRSSDDDIKRSSKRLRTDTGST
jgi:hypothetical protein